MDASSTRAGGARRCQLSFRSTVALGLLLGPLGAAVAQQAPGGGSAQATGTAAGVVAPATAVIGARSTRSANRPAATTGRVVGIITDAATGEPLVGGQVAVRGLPLGNVSDDAGAYFINNVPAGSQVLAVEYLGYEPQAQELAVEAGAQATLDFALQPSAIELAEIVVEEETVRDLSEYVQKAPRPTFDAQTVREVEVARSDTSLMEEWHRQMRDLTVVHAIEYPLAGTTVYFRRPKPLKRPPAPPPIETPAPAAADSPATAEVAEP